MESNDDEDTSRMNEEGGLKYFESITVIERLRMNEEEMNVAAVEHAEMLDSKQLAPVCQKTLLQVDVNIEMNEASDFEVIFDPQKML